MADENVVTGKAVLETLAEIYEQLYVEPGEKGELEYPDIVRRGEHAKEKSLAHFRTDARDTMEYMETPAGAVRVITLYHREDFITFLRIMANRCAAVSIPDTQGASIIDGVINWRKIEAHKKEFFENEAAAGDLSPDWGAEFKKFTSVKANFKDAIIILSVGPYSAIPASDLGFAADKWISLSDTIRKYHECTHFICRRKYPDKIDAVWDELVADAVGIYAAFGRSDPGMEAHFLGIRDGLYTGGRLENYVDADNEEEKKAALDELSAKIQTILGDFERITSLNPGVTPFELAEILENTKENYSL